MSETADKMPSPGLLAQASSHYVTLSYYIIRDSACQLFFRVIFNKIFNVITVCFYDFYAFFPLIGISIFSSNQLSL